MTRRLDPRLAAVLSEGLLGRAAFGMVSFAFPLYALALGLSLVEIGLLVTLRSVVVLPAKPVAGILVDRIGLRAVYVTSGIMRVVAAVGLLVAGDFYGLAGVRVIQGISAAGRDVGSLGLIAHDGERRVATIMGWYITAKHVGGVTGAGIAGIIIALSGGTYTALFLLVAILSAVPVLVTWWALEPDSPRDRSEEIVAGARPPSLAGWRSTLRELAGPVTVGGLIAASAYMLHGLFPILATEYAGLTTMEAGILYSLSAATILVVGPLAGWSSDRWGPIIGLAWRPVANIGSSLLYLVAPTFAGFTGARLLDDSGKAAFRPAWAATTTAMAARDPARRGQRLGILDAGQSAGEALGPLLAVLLWQSGGVVLLFAGRIGLAIVGEVAAMRVFGEADAVRAWLASLGRNNGQRQPPAVAPDVLRDAEVRHELRAQLTVARAEIEVVLAHPQVSDEERARSVTSALAAIERVTTLVTPTPAPASFPPAPDDDEAPFDETDLIRRSSWAHGGRGG